MPELSRAWLVVFILLGCSSRATEPRATPPPLTATPAPPAPLPPPPPPVEPTEPVALPSCKPAKLAIEAPPIDHFGPKRRAKADNVCDVADTNLAGTQAAILALPAPVPAGGPPPRAWDRTQPPARLELIARRFGLTAADRRQLARDGFVVPDRLAQPSWAWAFHEVYQSQLPIYVSADSLLHAVYAAHDRLLAQLERTELAPRLAAMLSIVHCALPVVATRFTEETARDLDLYLTVARSLLQSAAIPSALRDASVDREARALVAQAKSASGPVTRELFGRPRVIDFSQYKPRSHYTGPLEPYFRASMWLSRLELNLVSRSSRSSAPGDAPDPRETPREAVAALALAELVAASGQGAELDRIEQVFALLAGRREDIPLPKLAELARTAGISDLRAPDVAQRLRAAIGDTYQRTARIHYMPQGSTVLPAIATLLGPRITPDTAALRPLAHSEVPERHQIRGGDLAYVLGHDRGRAHLQQDLAKFPTLGKALDDARAILTAAPRGDDLYSAWLDAILALAVRPRGVAPSFMATEAYADLRVNSAIAAYAQLRHNHVLIAGQSYGEGGCHIPDGYVEPAVAVYDAIAAYADLGSRRVALLGGTAATTRAYFERLGTIARVLAAISRIELAGQPLPIEAMRWLSMVVEILPFGSDGRPTYTGWYFDLFEDRSDGIGRPDLVADYFTSITGVGHIGAEAPRLGVFVVDTRGGPRAMIGPVARAYEHHTTGRRLTDEDAAKLSARDRASPWTARYAPPPPPEPSFRAELIGIEINDQHEWVSGMRIDALHPIPSLTIQLLDHHRVPVATITRSIPKGTTEFRLPEPKLPEGTMIKDYGFIAGDFRAIRQLATGMSHYPVWFGNFPPDRYDSEE